MAKTNAGHNVTTEQSTRRTNDCAKAESTRANSSSRVQCYTFEEDEKAHNVLADITHKANVAPLASASASAALSNCKPECKVATLQPNTVNASTTPATGVQSPANAGLCEKAKRSLSTKIGRCGEQVMSGITTPNRGRAQGFRGGNCSYWQGRRGNMQSQQCGYFRSPSRMVGSLRKLDGSQSSFFLSPAQYNVITERSQHALKEYFKKKKLLQRKYADMLSALKLEEAAATKCAVMQAQNNKLRGDLESILDDIHVEYSITANLLQQQQLLEEEEHYRSYHP